MAAIITGGALLAAVIALYTRTERQVIERHNQHQSLMVQAVGSALGQEIERRLETFASVAVHVPPAASALPAAFQERLRGAGFQDLEVRNSKLFTSGRVITGQAVLGDDGILIPVAASLPGDRTLRATLPFRSFGPFLEEWNKRVGGRLWLLDDEGRLIYSRLHPNMLGRSALGTDLACLKCHSSFQMEASMVAGEAAAVEHQVADRPNMLVCYAPVTFGARRWSLALSDPQSEITELIRSGFLQASLLTALFLALVVTSGIGMVRFYLQKVEAERRAAVAENRARLEARMMRAEQLAAIGKMTAQIAHEINTPLASISLNVTYVLSEVERLVGGMSGEVGEAAEEIQREVERLKSFTGECLKLTRIHRPHITRVSLTGVVRGFLGFISREAARRKVRLQAAFDSEPITVRGDGDLLRQVLLNLSRNAFDAMPHGGRLEITLFRRDGVAELAIADSGPGIPPEQREKIFEAFFTTKSEGTGLGLAIARRIVEQHSGRVECRATPGGGAQFVMRLPLAAEVAAGEASGAVSALAEEARETPEEADEPPEPAAVVPPDGTGAVHREAGNEVRSNG